MAPDPPQRHISEACEEDLVRYGDNFRGAGYTKSPDEAEERYAVMLNVVRERNELVSVLDLGCGLGHMHDHIRCHPERAHVAYTGLDISPKYVEAASERNPEADFLLMDVLEDDAALGSYDYVILNGLLNFRGEVSHERMVEYWKELTSVAFAHCRRGIAFNVMSKLVDWERDDLFHLPFDVLGEFVAGELSRHFVVRHDYPAYEYTAYVYRQASAS